MEMLTFVHIRLATQDATFSIKETQIAIVADLGTLQRIGKITSKGFSREMVRYFLHELEIILEIMINLLQSMIICRSHLTWIRHTQEKLSLQKEH
jgi:hypothetical protein